MGKESVVHSWDREKGYTCTGNKTSTPKYMHQNAMYYLNGIAFCFSLCPWLT